MATRENPSTSVTDLIGTTLFMLNTPARASVRPVSLSQLRRSASTGTRTHRPSVCLRCTEWRKRALTATRSISKSPAWTESWNAYSTVRIAFACSRCCPTIPRSSSMPTLSASSTLSDFWMVDPHRG